jgi:hypothetical protein
VAATTPSDCARRLKLRLVVASLETAKEVGIDWWEHDPWLTGKKQDLELENERLRAHIERLEQGTGNALR